MNYRSIAVLLCAVALVSCEKNGVQDITGPLPGSSVKFYNFGVNAPGVNFYANDTKMTAISSTDSVESTTGTEYGEVGAGGFYTAIAPGQYTLSGKIADSVDKNRAISKVATTLEDGKYYSFYQSGIYNATAKTVDAFVVEDPFPQQIDYTAAYVRFVNAISNSSPMTLYAKGSAGAEVAVGGAVPYKGAGAFTKLPPGVYNLSTRAAGSSTNLITATDVSFSAGQIYTISAGGDMAAAGDTTSTNGPFLNNTANR